MVLLTVPVLWLEGSGFRSVGEEETNLIKLKIYY